MFFKLSRKWEVKKMTIYEYAEALKWIEKGDNNG